MVLYIWTNPVYVRVCFQGILFLTKKQKTGKWSSNTELWYSIAYELKLVRNLSAFRLVAHILTWGNFFSKNCKLQVVLVQVSVSVQFVNAVIFLLAINWPLSDRECTVVQSTITLSSCYPQLLIIRKKELMWYYIDINIVYIGVS